jgi:hypothetical protein
MVLAVVNAANGHPAPWPIATRLVLWLITATAAVDACWWALDRVIR